MPVYNRPVWIPLCPVRVGCLRLIVLFLLLACFTGISVLPADAETGRKPSTADLPIDPEFQPVSGIYYYDVFLKNMRIGKATITVNQTSDMYTIQVAAKTRSLLRSLYKVRYKGEVEMTPNPLQPLSARIEEHYGRTKKEIQMRFPDKSKVTSVEVKTKGGKQPTTTEREFESESFVLDPFSTVFLIRSLDWHVGMTEVFDIFTGKKQYELKLFCQSVTTLDIAGMKREAWVIWPQTTSLTEPREVKMSNFSVYLSRDAQKEVLKIKGEPNIGRIVARIRKFKELPAQ